MMRVGKSGSVKSGASRCVRFDSVEYIGGIYMYGCMVRQ